MGIFSRLGKSRKAKAASERAYAKLVAAARSPGMYGDQGIPDTEAGRFDALLMWLAMLICRLRDDGADANEFLRGVIGEFALDMDRTVREAGVGDLGVGKRVKQMVGALYARADAVEKVLDHDQIEAGRLDDYVRRTIFGDDPDAAQRVQKVTRSVAVFAKALDGTPTETLIAGELPPGQ